MRKLLPFIFLLTLLSGCAGATGFRSEADERLYRSIESGGKLDDVRASVEGGASIDALRRGRFVSENMVEFAIYCGRTDIAEWLIKNGADANYKSSIMGESLLMFMAAAAEPELCKLLLDNGADITATDRLGDTALEYAFKAPAGVPEHVIDGIVTLLIENGAQMRRETLTAALGGYSGDGDGDCRYGLVHRVAMSVDAELRPSVFYTAAFGTPDAISAADLKSTDADGNTPLIVAARYGNAATARYLMEQKPNFAAKNNRGQTAADAARDAGYGEFAAIIDEGASVAAASFGSARCCECCGMDAA